MSGITLVQNSGLTALYNNNPALTAVAAGDTLILPIVYVNSNSGQAATTPTITDNLGGTWLTAVAPTQQHTYGVQWIGTAVFYLPNAASGNHTATITCANNFWIADLAEFSGLPTTASVDQTTFGGSANAGATTGSSGNTGNTTVASELLIAGFGGTFAPGSGAAGITNPVTGFTSLGAYQTTSTGNIGAEFCYQIVSTMGVYSAQWAWTDTTNKAWQGVLATFKGFAATSGAAGMLMGVG